MNQLAAGVDRVAFAAAPQAEDRFAVAGQSRVASLDAPGDFESLGTRRVAPLLAWLDLSFRCQVLARQQGV